MQGGGLVKNLRVLSISRFRARTRKRNFSLQKQKDISQRFTTGPGRMAQTPSAGTGDFLYTIRHYQYSFVLTC